MMIQMYELMENMDNKWFVNNPEPEKYPEPDKCYRKGADCVINLFKLY